MIETFSGIGAQKRGFDNSGLFDVEVLATSDLDKDAIIEYAAMHHGLTPEMVENYENYPSREDMAKELTEKKIGYDFTKDKEYDWYKLIKRKTKELEKHWLATHLSKNLGDICSVNELPYCDILTFSFPCQSISVAGRQEGIIEGETRSGLVYEIVRLIRKAKENNTLPKYLLLENVQALVSKKFINDFNNLNEFFNEMGYTVYWEVINGKDCGIPQSRPRTFGIYIRKDIDTGKFEFPKPFDNGLRLCDFLEDDEEIIGKYFLSDEVQQRLQITDETFTKNIVGTTKPEFRTIGQRDLVYQKNGIIGALVATDYKQPKQILENKPYHVADLCSKRFQKLHEQSRRIYDERGASPTIPTLAGGHHEVKVSRDNLKVVRKLTPTEGFLLIGFTKEDAKNCYRMGSSDTALYRAGGNSIMTCCIELLAEHLYKAQYDSTYICTDENFTQPQV